MVRCAHHYGPVAVKLNKGGSSRLLGSRELGSRSSSKKVCAQASMGDILREGVYSSRRLTTSMASGGVRGRNTCVYHQRGRGGGIFYSIVCTRIMYDTNSSCSGTFHSLSLSYTAVQCELVVSN